MTLLKESEIKAITNLLKDDDETTFSLMEEQLRKFDQFTLKEIDNYISKDDSELKEIFLSLVYKIKREKIREDLSSWAKSGCIDLEEPILLIAEFENPFLDKDKYRLMLDFWSKKLAESLEEVKLSTDPSSIINEVNHFLFMELGFDGNKQNYYCKTNSFIDKVIDSKRGNPILLSILYMLLAQRVNLNFKGVAMPAHFIIKYVDKESPIYVDPFNQGEIITEEDCKNRVENFKLPWTNDYLAAPSNGQIISRVLQNLVNIYQSAGEYGLKEYLEGYIEAIKP